MIKLCEGWSKDGKPYICLAGYWTTGYGALQGLDGKRVTKNSPALTKTQGEELLRRRLARTEKAVHVLVGLRLRFNQFSACVSLVFNLGSGNFVPGKFVKGSYVRTTKERRTSGGSGEGADRQGAYCRDWLNVKRRKKICS